MTFDVYPKARLVSGGRTEILLSFGGADGFQFAAWLRLALLKIRNQNQGDYVYLDTYGLLDVAGSELKLTVMRSDSLVEPAAVRIDLGSKQHTGGQVSGRDVRGGVISTSNMKEWNNRYVKAMNEASGMVFIITKAWNESKYCRQEFDQCVERCGERLGPVVLYFQDLLGEKARFETLIKGQPAFARCATFITAQRSYAVSDAGKRAGLSPTMRDLFTISEADVRRVADAAKIKRD